MLIAVIALLLVVFVVLPLVGLAIWTIFTTALFGLIIGALGRLIVPGKQSISILATIAVGIAGSLIGTGIGNVIDAGWFVTVLLELGVAAGGVALVSSRSDRAVGSGRRKPLSS